MERDEDIVAILCRELVGFIKFQPQGRGVCLHLDLWAHYALAAIVAGFGELAVGNAVGQHMFDKANMMAPYNPTNDAMPVGRCTSCHMPKVAKSGGYVMGVDANGAQTIVEGDQASHVFDIIWPWQANAISRGGPSYQSGYYGQFVSAGNVKYDAFGYMPSSCSKCHVGSRRASIVCPDATPGAPVAGETDRAVWPLYWPLSEHRSDPFWKSCYTTATAP